MLSLNSFLKCSNVSFTQLCDSSVSNVLWSVLLGGIYRCEEACKTGLRISRTHPFNALSYWGNSTTTVMGKGREILAGLGRGGFAWRLREWCPLMLIPFGGDIPHIRYQQGRQDCTVLSSPFLLCLMLTLTALNNSGERTLECCEEKQKLLKEKSSSLQPLHLMAYIN